MTGIAKSILGARFKDLRPAGWDELRPFNPGELTGMAIEFLADLEGTRPRSGLFDGIIAPLIRYAIRGVIRYQGEGNAGRAWRFRYSRAS